MNKPPIKCHTGAECEPFAQLKEDVRTLMNNWKIFKWLVTLLLPVICGLLAGGFGLVWSKVEDNHKTMSIQHRETQAFMRQQIQIQSALVQKVGGLYGDKELPERH